MTIPLPSIFTRIWSAVTLGAVLLAGAPASGDPATTCAASPLATYAPDFIEDGDFFGYAVATDNDWVVVGAIRSRASELINTKGAVYLLRRRAGHIVSSQVLSPDYGFEVDYGAAVDIQGDTIIVGAPETIPITGQRDAGMVFIFTDTADGWTLTQSIRTPEVDEANGFGTAVLLAGDLLFVGSPGNTIDERNSGAVYLYKRIAGQWVQQNVIRPDAPFQNTGFGSSIDYDSGTLAIGAPGRIGVFVAEQPETITDPWSVELLEDDVFSNIELGHRVAIDGDLILASAPDYYPPSSPRTGAVVPFIRDNSGHWEQLEPIPHPCPGEYPSFGEAMELTDSHLIVSSADSSAGANPNEGIFVFERDAHSFTLQAILQPDRGEEYSTNTAVSIASQDGLIFAGVAFSHLFLEDAGSLQIFGNLNDCDANDIIDICDPKPEGFADCNLNGIDDVCEIAGGITPDINQNGVPDNCENDCNENGIPDEYETHLDPSLDCNQDSIPDECQYDLNRNEIPDACEIAANPEIDCDNNVLIDELELAFFMETPQFHLGRDETYEFEYAPPFIFPGETDLTIELLGDFDDFRIELEGRFLHYERINVDCSRAKFSVPIPRRMLENALRDDGVASFSIFNDTHHANFCRGRYIRATVGPRGYTDCNRNAIPDSCDINSGLETDCNNNAIIDRCEVASREPDCDGNKIPDVCETIRISEYSQTWTEYSAATSHAIWLESPPQSWDSVSIGVIALGNLSPLDSYIDVHVNGGHAGRLHEFNGTDCGTRYVRNNVDVPGYVFNELMDPVLTVIEVIPSHGVDNTSCERTFLEFSIEYQGITPADCNANDRVDICDVLQGVSPDVNNNLIPDECELSKCDVDLDGSGIVDVNDISFVLFRLGDRGSPGPFETPGDLDFDGRVTVNDISYVLARIGHACP